MDFVTKKSIPNPKTQAGLLSKIFYHWTTPLLRKGLKEDLTIDDMYDVLEEDQAKTLGDKLEREWKSNCKKTSDTDDANKNPSLLRTLHKLHGKLFLFLSAILVIDECVIRLAQPIFVRLFIRSFSNPSSTSHDEKLYYAIGICVSSLIHVFILHICNFELSHIGMKARVGVSSLIFRKVLRLSKSGQQSTNSGQINNILSNDVNQLNVIYYPAYVLAGPLQLIPAIYILWEEFGIACLAGVGLILIMAPVQYFLGVKSAQFRRVVNGRRDTRSKTMNEIISAIHVIKLYVWEKPFSDLINKLRLSEIKALKNRSYARALYTFLSLLSNKFILFLTILAVVLMGDVPEAEKVFFALTIFNILGLNIMQVMPTAVAAVNELIASLKRIENFLLLDEKPQPQPNISTNTLIPESSCDCYKHQPQSGAIHIRNLNARWTTERQTLRNINIDLKPGKLILIVGPVGSGKSSLLNTILGELPAQMGTCNVDGKISYVAQEPWVFSGNIRQNILFSEKYNKTRYEEILKCCSLNPDLRQWANTDETIVGERGVTLSGGQKSRVNIARALYRKADIYLMDDPLSAVDSRVSRHIFDKCIVKYLKEKLRVLVTHQLQYLPQADTIIVLNEGEVLAQGTYRELIERNIDLLGLMARDGADDDDADAEFAEINETILIGESQLLHQKSNPLKSPENRETQQTGAVTLRTYLDYFLSGGSNLSVTLILIGFIMVQALSSYSNFWLSHWANEIDYLRNTIDVNCTVVYDCLIDEIDNGFWVYLVLILCLAVGFAMVPISHYRYTMQIGINVHDQMFSKIIRAPMKFFENNSSGKIMNRFTKDLGAMDEQLPGFLYETIDVALRIVGTLILIVVANNFMIVPTLLVFLVLVYFRRYYIRTARDLRRLEATSRSPLLSCLSATYDGLTTIRALNAEGIIIEQFDAQQDISTSTWYLSIATTRWFAQNLQLICVLYLTLVTFGFITFTTSSTSGNVGLAVSSAMLLSGIFQYGLRQSAETENQMVSVERILEYTNISQEPGLESDPEKKPEADWPYMGGIVFKDVSLSYDNVKVLKELSFEIMPQEKVGIIGRTGAGKSSIAATFFRMTEPTGDIWIDGVSTQNIGLHDLRKSMSIIPQNPVLFSGTIRHNLDPFEEYKDEDLWKALEQVELKHAVCALDFEVANNGNNFSVGQKQLICLARAILRNRQILVLDEATANVDPGTEKLIQATIRDVFSGCTIITIAHRLNSVMECDRILVMDDGNLQENDSPAILLQDPNGYFTSLVNHTGISSADRLHRMANEALANPSPSPPTRL